MESTVRDTVLQESDQDAAKSTLEPIRIFIGSSIRNVIEQKVYCYTLKKYAKRPLDFNIIDGLNGTVTNLTTGEVKQLPADITQYIPGTTAFTLARWAIPEWCNYQGKAIYCDSDQLALADIAELWDLPLEDSFCAAVPVKKAKCYPHYVRLFLRRYLEASDDYYLASVMLIDCEKATGWSLESLVKLVRAGAFTLEEMMYLCAPFRDYFGITVKALPDEWNHLDVVYPESKIVHFTDMSTQPWRFHHNAISSLWDSVFLEAIDRQELERSEIVRANQLGYLTQRHKVISAIGSPARSVVNWLWRTPIGAIVLFFRFFKELFEDVFMGTKLRVRRLVKGY